MGLVVDDERLEHGNTGAYDGDAYLGAGIYIDEGPCGAGGIGSGVEDDGDGMEAESRDDYHAICNRGQQKFSWRVSERGACLQYT